MASHQEGSSTQTTTPSHSSDTPRPCAPAQQQDRPDQGIFVSLLFCVISLVATSQQALRGLRDDTTLSALPLLVGPAYCLVALGFFALTIVMLIDFTRIRSGRSYLFREEAPPA